MSYDQKAIVVHEKWELDHKLDNLNSFIETTLTFESLHHGDQELLREQRAVMKRYSEILGRRIERF